MSSIKSFKDLLVWKKSILISVEVYNLTKMFHKEEIYGLTSQIRRASVSVSLNIAEGFGKNTLKSYISYLRNALGSLNELESGLYLSVALGYVKEYQLKKVFNEIEQENKMLNSLIASFKRKVLTTS